MILHEKITFSWEKIPPVINCQVFLLYTFSIVNCQGFLLDTYCQVFLLYSLTVKKFSNNRNSENLYHTFVHIHSLYTQTQPQNPHTTIHTNIHKPFPNCPPLKNTLSNVPHFPHFSKLFNLHKSTQTLPNSANPTFSPQKVVKTPTSMFLYNQWITEYF